jgi:aspartate/glutamate racemase
MSADVPRCYGEAGRDSWSAATEYSRRCQYGCTEIDLLVTPQDASVPVFDTTRIHVESAVDWALG